MKKITTNKISTCLWFDKQAEEAAEFYVSLFDDAKILERTPYLVDTPSDKPVGSVMTVDFVLEGYKFTALNGGPIFTPNPSISFFINFDPSKDARAAEQLDRTWKELARGGNVLMELGEYPFSPTYGWVQDRYGFSWQLILSNPDGDDRPFIMPSLMFSGENTNKAEEAIHFYRSVFSNSNTGTLARYPEDTGPAEKGALMYGDFMIKNTWLAAMDSGVEQDFTFNEAISLVVSCKTQDEIDYYWDKLSAVSEAEVCGWLKDKYGVSWQIVPSILGELMQNKNPKKSERVMEAILEMKKLDIEKLKQAHEA